MCVQPGCAVTRWHCEPAADAAAAAVFLASPRLLQKLLLLGFGSPHLDCLQPRTDCGSSGHFSPAHSENDCSEETHELLTNQDVSRSGGHAITSQANASENAARINPPRDIFKRALWKLAASSGASPYSLSVPSDISVHY